jgi:hypothetical protein
MYVYKFTTDNPPKPWSIGLNTDNGLSVLCYCDFGRYHRARMRAA